jgi:prophage antirepressor-like protein
MNAQHHNTTETATIRQELEVNDRVLSAYFRRVEFHDRTVTAVCFRGRWTFRAAEVGMAIGYEHGRYLADKIGDDWKEEFREGHDYDVLRGAALREYLAAGNDSGDSPVSFGRGGARSLLVLYESGIDRALILARTPRGRELRDLLVEHVLPQLRCDGHGHAPRGARHPEQRHGAGRPASADPEPAGDAGRAEPGVGRAGGARRG